MTKAHFNHNDNINISSASSIARIVCAINAIGVFIIHKIVRVDNTSS